MRVGSQCFYRQITRNAMQEAPPPSRFNRRVSVIHVPPVCAEAYNPDEEEEDTEPRVVHPKTDEQRCRLQEACRDILLFKTLDQVQPGHPPVTCHEHTHFHYTPVQQAS
ncbi:hypothetical protein JZ751_021746 [Albula glossodonta]|uniref:Uncharacterized protein n=1 Tax=Albula glossodonta TaxID=121402 RepID=A0A8T2NJ81_9TELE|nr:hypothetical protein JZ751_021746 [Albula glossodonta]